VKGNIIYEELTVISYELSSKYLNLSINFDF
jgi:hypothetical protein